MMHHSKNMMRSIKELGIDASFDFYDESYQTNDALLKNNDAFNIRTRYCCLFNFVDAALHINDATSIFMMLIPNQ